jgi:uncharacterized protein (TIGR02996 family)
MERALEAALAAWRQHPTAALADHLDQLSDELTGRSPAIGEDAWDGLCALRRPADLGPLLAALTPTSSQALGAKLDRLQGWPADPRVTTALHRLTLQRLPRSSERAFWRRALGLIARVADVRAASWLAELLPELDGPASHGRALTMRANELIVSFGRQPGLLERRQPLTSTAFTAIVRAPADPLAREVLADQLLELGDARGELIRLQGLAQPRLEQRRRANALLREFSRAWLGRLSAALKPEGLRFEHGFVVAGRLSGYRALRHLTGAPEWESLRELDLRELRWRRSGPSTLIDFLSHPVLRQVTRLEGFPPTEVGALLRSRAPLPVESLSLSGRVGDAWLEALRGCPALPSLKTLRAG